MGIGIDAPAGVMPKVFARLPVGAVCDRPYFVDSRKDGRS
jgi:hypothetical protein